MVKKQAIILIGTIIICLLAFSFPVTAETSIEILCPSEQETVVAPGRDFYVIGTIDTDLETYAVSVTLVPKAERSNILRYVYAESPTEAATLFTGYEGLTVEGGDGDDVAFSAMPDLVYDGSDESTFGDVWRKLTYGDGFFAALISGGSYDQDLRLVDESGAALAPLSAGEYVIIVTVTDGAEETTEELELTVGVSEDKLCSRFSPAAHFDAVSSFAAEEGWRVYDDPFAGYWQGARWKTEVSKDLQCEIEAKWRFSERQEYGEGTTHVVLYNIGAQSTTNSVELGVLQDVRRIDSSKYYYYDLGEPQLTVEDKKQRGKLQAMATGDRLDILRLDGAVEDEKENVFDPAKATDVLCTVADDDWDISAYNGEHFALYGVMTPIQNERNEIKASDDGTYSIDRRIEDIRYSVTDAEGEVIQEYEKPVGLTRQLDTNWKETSIYEFRHIFDIEDFGGAETVTLEIAAVDSDGNLVDGSEETLTLDLAAAEPPQEEDARDNTQLERVLLIILAGLIAVVILTIVILAIKRR